MAVYDDQDQKTTDEAFDDITSQYSPEEEAAMEQRAREGADSEDGEGGKGDNGDGSGTDDGDKKDKSPDAGERAALGAKAGGSDKLGAGFSPDGLPTSKAAALKVLFSRNKRKAAFGGGIIGLILGMIFLIMTMLIPLKVESIVNSLQNHFFSSSESAIDGETQSLFTSYITKHVLPSYKSCGTTVSKKCSVTGISGSDPVSNLYRTWANAKLENKLAGPPYNVEFRYNTANKTWYIKVPSNGNGDPVGHDGEKLSSYWQRTDKAGVRQYVRDSIANETLSKKIYYHLQVGRLLEEKYGIKRCLVWCGITDPLAKNINAQKEAAKIYLVQRVITPRDQNLGIVLECLLSTSCSATDNQPSDGSDSAENGEAQGAVDKEVEANLATIAESYGSKVDVKVLTDLYKQISDEGFSKYIVTYILTKLGAGAFAQGASNFIPIVGWINLTAKMITFANNAGPVIKKLSYVTNAAAAVSLYMSYRTYADEIHTGHVTGTEVGSFVGALGPGDSGSGADSEVGGTASAEQTPLYGNLIDGDTDTSTSTTTSLLDSVLPANAYAASKKSTDTSTVDGAASSYLCKDGKPVPAGKLICDEEVLGQGNKYANTLHNALNNTPVLAQLTFIAGVWKNTFGKVINGVQDVAQTPLKLLTATLNAQCKVIDKTGVLGNLDPGVGQYCQAQKLVNKLTPTIVGLVSSALIPNPFGTNMSGGRTFDMMAAGADVAGNESAHTTLGGRLLTPQESTAITNEQENAARQSFQNQPFFARMFSTDTQYSLISRVAMDMPINFEASVQTSFATILSNPFGVLAHGFGSIFATRVIADAPAQDDPFGVQQYGYTDSDLPADPEAYWNANCSDNAAYAYRKTNDWNEAAAHSDVTSDSDPSAMPYNTTTNPCLLIKAVTGDDGGQYDSSLLTPDDLADSDNTPTDSNTDSDTFNTLAAKQVLNQTKATVGYAIYDASGDEVASTNETTTNYGASITKSMLLVAYLNQVGSGTLSATAKSKLTAMIENSDNAAANWVYNHLKKPSAAVQAVATKAGMNNFTIDTSDKTYVLGQSRISADDFAQFFATIDTYMPAKQKDFGMGLLANLSSADQKGLLQAGLTGTVYSKEGWKPESSGTNGAPYVVNQAAQFSLDGTTYGIAVTVGGTKNQASGEAIIKNLVTALLSSSSN